MRDLIRRDPTVAILFVVGLLLVLLNATAAVLLVAAGPTFLPLVEATMLLTGAFAVAGIGFGLARSLRARRPRK